MAIKINQFEIENVKRVKAVKVEPTATGLTIIGGKNRQGKTSILDAIAWVLGGNKFKPSEPAREGSVTSPYLQIKLSNGLIVERKGKNSDLKVIDPTNTKGGQQLLDTFVEQLALDLPRFLHATNKEKAQTLLQIIGVGEQLHKLEKQEQELYNRRRTIGQIADQKSKFAKEQPYFADAPKDLVSASDLIKQQQDILAKNGENQRKRDKLKQLESSWEKTQQEILVVKSQMDELNKKYNILMKQLLDIDDDIQIAEKTTEQLQDESTEELETNIRDIEEINRKVRANLDKDKAEEDARDYSDQYDALTTKIADVRQSKTNLLESADLPLPGLSVSEGELVYNGQKWDNVAGSDQLKVAVAIVRKLNPKCGFVLLDKLEQMDLDTLAEFGQWLEQEGLQAIATRVSTGDECSIIISDGYVAGATVAENATVGKPKWKAGEF